MSSFTWNFMGRIAYSPDQRHRMQEYNGWWNHVAFGLYVFTKKKNPGWVNRPD